MLRQRIAISSHYFFLLQLVVVLVVPQPRHVIVRAYMFQSRPTTSSAGGFQQVVRSRHIMSSPSSNSGMMRAPNHPPHVVSTMPLYASNPPLSDPGTRTTTPPDSSSSNISSTNNNWNHSQSVPGKITLRRYLNSLVKEEPGLRDMESLSVSIQIACKTISDLVHRNGITQVQVPPQSVVGGMMDDTTTTTPDSRDLGLDQYDMRMNSMKRLDQISTTVLRNALRFTGKLQMVKPAKDVNEDGDEEGPGEHQPGVLIASAIDSKYVAFFDPLDGSGNADAAICTGTVFGIFERDEEEEKNLGHDDDDDDDDFAGIDNVVVGGGDGDGGGFISSSPRNDDLTVNAVLQPGRKLRAAGYCLYSSATILVFTLGEGTHGFTLDPQINEFVLSHPNIRIPPRGNVYSCNEANSEGWSDDLKEYVKALKTGENETGERYASRYVGSMVGDIHRTLMYGGIFFYPSDSIQHPKGNLQLLYKCSPMSFVIEQAGGKSTNGIKSLLDVQPKRVHERSPCFIGSPDNIDEMKKYIEHEY